MPLHELYRMAKGKLDSREMINTSCAPDQSTVPENDFLELVWENGQISVQGQSSRGRKSPTTCKSLPSHCLPSHCTNNYNSNNNDMMMRMGKFGDLDSGFNELRMPVPSGEDVGLTQDEDVMMPWLNYAMDEPLQHEYSSGFLHELSGVTMNDLPASNNFSLLDKRSNCNQVFRDSHRNYALSKGPSAAAREVENPAPKAGTSQFYHPSSHQYQASFASVRSRVSDVTENNASNATHHAPNCGDITQIFPSASSGFSSLKVMDKQDPIMSSSSSMTTIMNFSHFARPAAIVKANLQNIGLSSSRSENIGNKNKAAAAATASNPPESTKVCLSGDCPKESPTLQKKQAVEASKADLKQLETKSLEGIAALSKQSDPARNEDVSKTDQNSNLLHCESSNKGQEPVEKNVEPAVASSSVCSGNGAERGSGDLNQNLRRKRRDHEDSECHSEDVEEVSAGVKRAAPARGGTGFKRSRSAEVHNLSERRRRDRINEKMRALQELIPNCNKVDKASMLDEAIEYLKTLQLQVQIMSMGAGYYMPPMMLPAGMQHMHPPHMASFTPMGVGMQMGLGMGYGMGMHDINGGSSRFPMMPVPHMQGPHLPVTSMSGPSAFNGMGRSNPQVFGVPGQRLTTPMQRAPIFSLPGEPVLNSPAVGLNASGTAGVMENAISASASGLKDQTLNTNSQAMQKTNGCNSTNQMTTQCEVTAGGFEHSAAPEANDGDAVNAVKEDNK